MDTAPEQKPASGSNRIEIILVVVLSLLVCAFVGFLGRGFLVNVFSGLSEPQATLPKHTVNDYQDNGKGTNFVYVIVADKSLSEEDAKKIISHYENKHPGYKILNVWIFCDSTYASAEYVNGVQYSDDPYLSHVMYWLMATKLGKAERWFHSGPDTDFPAFRSACR